MTKQTIPVPTLSHSGWIYSTSEKADFLFSHFYESEKSQTFLYGQNVSNLQYIIEQNKNSISDCCRAIQSTLSTYFLAYFPEVTVEIDYKEEPVNSGQVTIRMFVTVTDVDGKEFNLSRLADLIDSKFERVRKLVNNGESF